MKLKKLVHFFILIALLSCNENSTKKILTEKIEDLHKIAKALLTYETLTGEEIEDIINKNKYPENKQDIAIEVHSGGQPLYPYYFGVE